MEVGHHRFVILSLVLTIASSTVDRFYIHSMMLSGMSVGRLLVTSWQYQVVTIRYIVFVPVNVCVGEWMEMGGAVLYSG